MCACVESPLIGLWFLFTNRNQPKNAHPGQVTLQLRLNLLYMPIKLDWAFINQRRGQEDKSHSTE